jgi:hypothetical protein
MRQTVADLFQLVREIQVGVDVDGDGSADLDAQRIYYAGQSWGGIYGGTFVAVEPAIQASVLNVAGGSLMETTRLGGFRVASRAIDLAARTPSLINLSPAPGIAPPNNLRFEESIPLRNQPVLVNNVPGAMGDRPSVRSRGVGGPVGQHRELRAAAAQRAARGRGGATGDPAETPRATCSRQTRRPPRSCAPATSRTAKRSIATTSSTR